MSCAVVLHQTKSIAKSAERRHNMPGPSFYYTLFKKFQVLNHVPGGILHGNAGAPAGGFNLTDPNAPNGVFGKSSSGHPLTIPDSTPAHSPLWAVLNSKAAGNADYSPVTISGGAQNGTVWPTMPPGTPPAWNNFQVNPPVKLVDVFANWISGGMGFGPQVKDIPNNVIGTVPPSPIAGPLDAGVSLFVCSMPNDVGIRPDAVPSNYWATSLIFLVDPNTGNTVFPATLTAGSEYYLAAVIGNRGNTDGGNYINPPGIETAGIVMVWNTVDSPGVELPSLSNLDVTDTNPIFEQYFLKSATYDIVGFRLNVQTVFDGIIAALNQNQAGTDGPVINLGGLTPDQWVHNQPAHLCAKVVIRQQGGAFPNVGDSPINNPHVAQKNLTPFDINVHDTMVPNIVWKNFITGTPFLFRLPGAGRSRLSLEVPRLPEDAFKFYIGIPTETFDRIFREGREGGVKGFKVVPPQELCESKLGNRAKPFPDAVVLRYEGRENALEFPALPEKHYLAMSLGIEYNVKRIEPGVLGEINFVHRAQLPKLKPGTLCFEIEETVAGGFTILLRAYDPFRGPRGKEIKF
jgi:hypothetical protein